MNRLKIFFAGVIAAGSVACTPKTVMPEFGRMVVDTTFQAGPMNFTVQYEFASIANAADSPALEAIEQANVAAFFGLEEFAGSAREAAAQAIAQLVEQGEAVDAAIEPETERHVFDAYVTSVSDAVVVDTVLVYSISFSEYTGGAHGMYGQRVRNYSLRGGYALELCDLFDDVQLQGLKTLVREKLYEQFGVSSDEGLAEQGFFPEYIDTTDNFAVTDDGGLVFYYNPYDIGCYALGSVEVRIDGTEIAALGE